MCIFLFALLSVLMLLLLGSPLIAQDLSKLLEAAARTGFWSAFFANLFANAIIAAIAYLVIDNRLTRQRKKRALRRPFTLLTYSITRLDCLTAWVQGQDDCRSAVWKDLETIPWFHMKLLAEWEKAESSDLTGNLDATLVTDIEGALTVSDGVVTYFLNLPELSTKDSVAGDLSLLIATKLAYMATDLTVRPLDRVARMTGSKETIDQLRKRMQVMAQNAKEQLESLQGLYEAGTEDADQVTTLVRSRYRHAPSRRRDIHARSH